MKKKERMRGRKKELILKVRNIFTNKRKKKRKIEKKKEKSGK